MHVIIHVSYRLADHWGYRKLRNCLGQKYGCRVTYQKVKYLDSILKHMMLEPRYTLGCNNMSLCKRMQKLKEGTNTTPQRPERDCVEVEKNPECDKPPQSFIKNKLQLQQTHVPKTNINDFGTESKEDYTITGFESKLVKRIDDAKKFIKKYNKETPDEISEQIMKEHNMDDLGLWRTLITHNAFSKIWAQAILENKISQDISGEDYIDYYIENVTASDTTLTTAETAKVFQRWCQEQRLDPAQLVVDIYCILSKSYPKRNTLALIGESNAGKTYWFNSLISADDIMGNTIISKDFTYMKCLNKRVIVIPEMTLTTPEQVEESKKIFEGQTTQVNVKNKEPAFLKRTPILLSANQTPWRMFGEESEAFRNRIIIHEHLRESNVLKTVTQTPDKRFWSELFYDIRNKFEKPSELFHEVWPPTKPDDMKLLKRYVNTKIERMSTWDNKKSETLSEMLSEIDVTFELSTYNNRWIECCMNLGHRRKQNTQEKMEKLAKKAIKILTMPDATDFHFNLNCWHSWPTEIKVQILDFGLTPLEDLSEYTRDTLRSTTYELSKILNHLQGEEYTGEKTTVAGKLRGVITAMFKQAYDEYTKTREPKQVNKKRKREEEEEEDDYNAYHTFTKNITNTSSPNTSTEVIIISSESSSSSASPASTKSSKRLRKSPTSSESTRTTSSYTKDDTELDTTFQSTSTTTTTSEEPIPTTTKRKRVIELDSTTEEEEPVKKIKKTDATDHHMWAKACEDLKEREKQQKKDDLWSDTDEDLDTVTLWKSFEWQWNRDMEKLMKMINQTREMPGDREVIEKSIQLLEQEYLNDLFTKDIEVDHHDQADLKWWLDWQPFPYKSKGENNQIKIDYLSMHNDAQCRELLSPLLNYKE